ncbi:MAG: hypothetical protein A4S09_13555 [Proteobacteria bacterium SG_bin7]|nr:MAG: hypothetical protein A4S09_13555 [Proteobacteria bacterium SG_bin7]
MQSVVRKRPFSLIINLILSLSCSFFSSGYAAEAEGGTHGGGGEILSEQNVDMEFLATEIPKMKLFVEMAINYFDLLAHFGESPDTQQSPAMDVAKKLKPFYEEMFKRLKVADFKILRDRACKDREQKDVDASVVDVDSPNEICVSVKTLSQKLTYKNYFESVVALLAHEVTHWYGTTEEEAVLLQRLLGIYLNPSQRFGAPTSDFEYELDNLAKIIKDIQIADEKGYYGKTCMALSNLQTTYSRLHLFSNSTLPGGLSVLNGKGWDQYMTAMIRIHFATSYCATTEDGEWQSILTSMKGRTELKVKDVDSNSPVTKRIEYPVILVSPQNKKDLKRALTMITENLNFMRAQLLRLSKFEIVTDGPTKIEIKN